MTKRTSTERALSLLEALRSVLLHADDFYNHQTAIRVLDTVKRILTNRVKADRRKKQRRHRRAATHRQR